VHTLITPEQPFSLRYIYILNTTGLIHNLIQLDMPFFMSRESNWQHATDQRLVLA